MVAGNLNSNNDIGRLAASHTAVAGRRSRGGGGGRRVGMGLACRSLGAGGRRDRMIANLYMTFAALRTGGAPRGALGRLFMGQLVKVALTVRLFAWRAVAAGMGCHGRRC